MRLYLYFVVVFMLVGGHLAHGQNFGINQPNPQERLHVTGNIRTDSALIMVPAAALVPANAITLPNNVSTITISLDDASNTDNVITDPTTPKEGQILTILNEDDDPATFANVAIAPTNGVNVYQYINSSWRLLSKSPAASGGAKVYYVEGSTDISLSGAGTGVGALMSGMTLTITPENPVLLLSFSGSGDLDFTSPAAGRVNFWFDIQKDGVTVRRNRSSILVPSSTVVPQRWERSFTVPISVTPGIETTIRLRWSLTASGISGTITFTNNAGSSGTTSYRLMTIQDGPLN